MPSPINHGSHPFVSTLACLITCLNPNSVLCLFTGSDGPWGHDMIKAGKSAYTLVMDYDMIFSVIEPKGSQLLVVRRNPESRH